jgi:hypothetical protein
MIRQNEMLDIWEVFEEDEGNAHVAGTWRCRRKVLTTQLFSIFS